MRLVSRTVEKVYRAELWDADFSTSFFSRIHHLFPVAVVFKVNHEGDSTCIKNFPNTTILAKLCLPFPKCEELNSHVSKEDNRHWKNALYNYYQGN